MDNDREADRENQAAALEAAYREGYIDGYSGEQGEDQAWKQSKTRKAADKLLEPMPAAYHWKGGK